MADAAVAVSGLVKDFAAVRAIDHLSFEVARGEIFGIVGPDGAGKTTTMRILAGVLAPDAGHARVAGHDVVGDPEGVKHVISYMPQRFGLYEDLTVDENIRFYSDLFGVGRREREARASELLDACAMSEFRSRMAGKLSGGMKQKLGLVCALIHTPRVLLLDEPTNGVDPAEAPATFPCCGSAPACAGAGGALRTCWATAVWDWPAMLLTPGLSATWSRPRWARVPRRVR